MELWDRAFRTYHDPTIFLNTVIENGQFNDFLQTMQDAKEKEERWQFYLHKLSFMDNRSWNQFNDDLDFETNKNLERPSDEVLVDIVRTSYDIMKNFNPEVEGGE